MLLERTCITTYDAASGSMVSDFLDELVFLRRARRGGPNPPQSIPRSPGRQARRLVGLDVYLRLSSPGVEEHSKWMSIAPQNVGLGTVLDSTHWIRRSISPASRARPTRFVEYRSIPLFADLLVDLSSSRGCPTNSLV